VSETTYVHINNKYARSHLRKKRGSGRAAFAGVCRRLPAFADVCRRLPAFAGVCRRLQATLFKQVRAPARCRHWKSAAAAAAVRRRCRRRWPIVHSFPHIQTLVSGRSSPEEKIPHIPPIHVFGACGNDGGGSHRETATTTVSTNGITRKPEGIGYGHF